MCCKTEFMVYKNEMNIKKNSRVLKVYCCLLFKK